MLFLHWAKQDTWRAFFERDLQPIAQDTQGRKLLSTWIPLVTFREKFCAGGRPLQDADTQELMERLRCLTIGWRSAQVDIVEINGRANLYDGSRLQSGLRELAEQAKNDPVRRAQIKQEHGEKFLLGLDRHWS